MIDGAPALEPVSTGNTTLVSIVDSEEEKEEVLSIVVRGDE